MRELIHYFKIFYTWVGNKLFLFAFAVFTTTIVESIGFTIALPIIEYGSEKTSKFSNIIYGFLENLGFEVSIISLVILIAIIFMFKSLIRLTQEIIVLNIVYKFMRDLRFDLVEQYRKMKYNHFINTKIGYFNNLITTEINSTISAFNRFVGIIVMTVSIAVYLFFALFFSWEVSLLAIFTIVCFYILFIPINSKIRRLSRILVRANSKLQNSFIQFILNFKYLKATSNFSTTINNLKKSINIQYKKGFEKDIYSKTTPIILELISMIMFCIAILFLVLIKGFEISAMMVTILFIYRVLVRVPGFQTSIQGFLSMSGSVDAIEKARIELYENSDEVGGVIIKTFNKKISLSNINFSFGEKIILSNICLEIPHNSSIGIVGESGSGKTTIADIITGLLPYKSGVIEIDGFDYDSINTQSLQSLFGYITQEPNIFNDTIFNNITMWDSDINNSDDIERVKKACKIANCSDFIFNTELGLNNIVGDKGIKLSGGQRQRIAIAREIYREAPITIFDEATSSLDTKSENLIKKSIDNLVGIKTMIIIAHRLSTIRNCDHIYVLNKGRLVEDGNWDDLVSDSNSFFAKMCKLQNI